VPTASSDGMVTTAATSGNSEVMARSDSRCTYRTRCTPPESKSPKHAKPPASRPGLPRVQQQATKELHALRKQFEVFADSMFSSQLNYIVCRSEMNRRLACPPARWWSPNRSVTDDRDDGTVDSEAFWCCFCMWL
jgi:hypothetical protein